MRKKKPLHFCAVHFWRSRSWVLRWRLWDMAELLNALELCIKQIIKEQESINGPILDESDVLYDLCVGLEACLRHDMKFGQ